MISCRLVNVLFDLFPWKGGRGFLIRRHLGSCPRCQARLASLEEVRELIVRPEDVGRPTFLWARLMPKLSEELPARRLAGAFFRVGWRAAAVAASFLVLAAAGLWLMKNTGPSARRIDAPPGSARFELNYVRIQGETARTFVYQPRDSSVIVVWAQKVI